MIYPPIAFIEHYFIPYIKNNNYEIVSEMRHSMTLAVFKIQA